jgi:5'(3')-deoxyribonucleotidase
VIQLPGKLKTLGIDLDRVSAQLERESIGAIEAGANTALTRLALAACRTEVLVERKNG